MSELSLHQAEVLHRAIGASCAAFGLEARYEGALATVISRGLKPLYQESRWLVFLAAPVGQNELDGLDVSGEALFSLGVSDKGEKTAQIELPFADGPKYLLARPTRRGKGVDNALKALGLSFAQFSEHFLGSLKLGE